MCDSCCLCFFVVLLLLVVFVFARVIPNSFFKTIDSKHSRPWVVRSPLFPPQVDEPRDFFSDVAVSTFCAHYVPGIPLY